MEELPAIRSADRPLKPEESLATTVALELIREAGYVQTNTDLDVLVLRSGRSLLVLAPRARLSEAEAEADLKHWHAKLTSNELSGISAVNLLYCLPAPHPELQKIRKRRKANFVGNRVVHLDYLDGRAVPRGLGSLDRSLTQAISRGQDNFTQGRVASPEDLRGALARSMVTHTEFASRLGAVTPIGTYTIFATCLLLFGWGTVVGGTEDMLTLLRFGANYPPLTTGENEWWRLYASTFLHIGFVHLLCNMVALLSVGLRLEQIYGTSKYLALYSFAGLCGSIASALTGHSVAAGASGALFGVFGAIVVLGRRFHAEWPAAYRKSMFQGMLPMVGYNLIYGFSNAGIDNAAHLGGLVAGCLFALVVRPQALQQTVLLPLARTALLVLGLLPFLSLGWVVRNVSLTKSGFAGFSQKQYSDPSGDLTVQLPALFVPTTEASESYLAGPGMIVLIKKLDEFQTVTIDNPLFIEGIQQAAGTTSVTTEVHDGRTWALRNGGEGEALVRQGFAYFGLMPVKIEVIVPKTAGKQGDQLRLMAIESLERKSYDRKVNGQALAEQGLHARALEELSAVKDSPEISLLRAKSLTNLARYGEAEEILTRLRTEDAENPEVAWAQALLLKKQRNYQQALKVFRAMKRSESGPETQRRMLAYEADLLDYLGDARGAQKICQQVLSAAQSDRTTLESVILNNQAWNLVLKGQYREALPLAKRSVKIKENSANLDTRGRAFLELGEYEKAKVDYEKILSKDFNDPYANYAMARILQHEGNAEAARNFYFRYLALAGANSEFAKDALERANQMQP